MGQKKKQQTAGGSSRKAQKAAEPPAQQKEQAWALLLAAAAIGLVACVLGSQALWAAAAGGGGVVEYECGPQGTEHLSDVPAQGLHVLTLLGDGDDGHPPCAGDGAGSASLRVSVDIDGFPSHQPEGAPVLQLRCGSEAEAEQWLLEPVRQIVERDRPALMRRLEADGTLTGVAAGQLQEYADVEDVEGWALFTPYGSAVRPTPAAIAAALGECGTLYVVEGGAFIWPGVRVGHTVSLSTGDPHFSDVTLTTVSLMPRVFTINPLLTDAECDWIVAAGEQEMRTEYQGSTARVDSTKKEGNKKSATGKRTSQQARLPKGGGEVVSRIEARSHRLLRLPESHGEPLQVIRYKEGEKYGNHHDYFDPELYKEQPGILEMIADGDRQRLATLLWYLSVPAAGGETHFPRAGGLSNPPVELPPCAFQHWKDGSGDKHPLRGVKVEPVRGMATLFYSLRPDGQLDPFSLHAGCPPHLPGGTPADEPAQAEAVGALTKWATNKWFWTQPWVPQTGATSASECPSHHAIWDDCLGQQASNPPHAAGNGRWKLRPCPARLRALSVHARPIRYGARALAVPCAVS
eukprot:COSAG02_NODE_7433_length_3015_cov_4.222565_2_plen_576_part_00